MFSKKFRRSIDQTRTFLIYFLLLLHLPSASFAQFLVEYDTGTGALIGGVEIGKTTDIGRFDDYVGPLLASEARSLLHGKENNSSVTTTNTSTATSSPSDVNNVASYMRARNSKLGLRYAGRLGWRFTVGYETSSFYRFDSKGLRISFYKSFDVNSLKAYAADGFGILIDPTHFVADVRIDNTALALEAPVHSFKAAGYDFTSYLGLGAIRNRTRSQGIAKSDFLDVSIVETRTIDRPLFSFAYRVRPLEAGGPSAIGLDFGAQLFRTSKMFNVNLNLALVKTFH